MAQISKELNFSTPIERGIKNNFGDPISICELSEISKYDFLSIRHLGHGSWRDFQFSLGKFIISDYSVVLVANRGNNVLNIDIDISKPFSQVIRDLSEIIEKHS